MHGSRRESAAQLQRAQSGKTQFIQEKTEIGPENIKNIYITKQNAYSVM